MEMMIANYKAEFSAAKAIRNLERELAEIGYAYDQAQIKADIESTERLIAMGFTTI